MNYKFSLKKIVYVSFFFGVFLTNFSMASTASQPLTQQERNEIAAKLIPIISMLLNEHSSTDTTPPAKPTLVTSVPATTTDKTMSVELEGEKGAKVYVNGVEAGTVDATGKVTILLTFINGDNNIRITLKDSAGNESEALVLNVTYTDTTAPVITLLGDNPMTLEVGQSYNEPGATALDDNDGNVTVIIATDLANELSTGVNKNRLGTYHVTYIAEDNAGNQASIKRTVYVRVLPSRKINDTGVDWGAETLSTNNTDCQGMSISQQDCSFGRDKWAREGNLSKTGSGAAGFDFTKLGSDGTPLAIQDQAYNENGNEADGTKWSCVKDNTTGLVWEVKRDVAQTSDLHSKEDYFAWHNTDATSNGGQSGNNLGDVVGQCYDMTIQNQSNPAAYCNTEAFIARVNTEKLCGFSDWRLPTREELSNIIYYGATSEPLIDQSLFPNTVGLTIPGSPYWTADPLAVDSNYNLAWLISFTSDQYSSYSAGETLRGNESANVGYILLVR